MMQETPFAHVHGTSAADLPERIKRATGTGHAEVEAVLELMAINNRARYVAVLSAFQGIWPGLEADIAKNLPELADSWGPRWRAEHLRDDLRYLGLPDALIDSLPLCRDLPRLDQPAAAWGALYVVEGSALGARFIARHLHDRFGFDASHGAAFFAGQGTDTGSRWLRFKELLQIRVPPDEQELAMQAAVDTFGSLTQWFRLTLNHG